MTEDANKTADTRASRPPAASLGTAPSLIVKLAEVMAALRRIPKLGLNEHFNFRYVAEADVLDSVRDELGRRHVVVVPFIKETQFEKMQSQRGGVMTFCTAKVDFTFMDGDTGETLVVPMIGQGTDSGAGDKAFYKALSGATKYVILKVFLLSSGDDPETSAEGQAAAQQKGQKKPPEQRPPSPYERILMLFKHYGMDAEEGKKLIQQATKKKGSKELVEADVLVVDVALGRWALRTAKDEKELKRAVTILKGRAKAFSEQDRDELQAIHNERCSELMPPEPGTEG